ncbi:MAG: DNA mismatch repair protein MutS [Myxococcota bacterium]
MRAPSPPKSLLPPGSKITPMLRQWLLAKERAPDALLLFRMGDFYEMFAQDAQTAAPILELALTSRDRNSKSPIPMAGFPHHAARGYIAKLLSRGLKVALCDQLEDPAAAKGIVKRAVTRVVTPGTTTDDDTLPPKASNYLVGISRHNGTFGIGALDWSTGRFIATASSDPLTAREELERLAPAEVLVHEHAVQQLRPLTQWLVGAAGSAHGGWRCRMETRALSASSADSPSELNSLLQPVQAHTSCKHAAQLVLEYVRATQGDVGGHVRPVHAYRIDKQLLMDASTRRHLGVDTAGRKSGESPSLLTLLDRTKTAMGGRALARMLQAPSTDLATINKRHDRIGALLAHPDTLHALQEDLQGVYDLERLTAKSASGRVNPRELAHLRDSLGRLPRLVSRLGKGKNPVLADLAAGIDPLSDARAWLCNALVESPPLVLREGTVFRDGYDKTLDELTQLAAGGRDKIAAIEARERQATGIPSLKVKYTRVFGYYIEVTKTHLGKVPASYRRKQTVAGAERYGTDELTRLEEQVATAEVRRAAREACLFDQLREKVSEQAMRVLRTATCIAQLDALCGFAQLSLQRRYMRPRMLPAAARHLCIRQGRHPVLELLHAQRGDPFVPSDVELSGDDRQILLITGPNMAGKSTVMRQTALIQLLAQAGCFVPAQQATLSVCDRLFARVGASDDLLEGRSTFMVEMHETAHILRAATPESLVLLDEIGRGTSTFDGLSIAHAVAEHLHNRVGARVLFATHYHELTALAHTLPRLRNVHVAVQEDGNAIAFLYTLRDGCVGRSYGLHVARLAGLPNAVLARAREVLTGLEREPQQEPKHKTATCRDAIHRVSKTVSTVQNAEEGNKTIPDSVKSTTSLGNADGQLVFFQPDPPTQPPAAADSQQLTAFLNKLSRIDVNRTTPLAALQQLAALRQTARKIQHGATAPKQVVQLEKERA